MIQVRQIRKRFGRTQAVDDVSFTAANGAITGLLGENGAGKTTTLSMICGIVDPDSGSIQVADSERGPRERRRRLGALLDHKGLYDRLTVRENIAYFGALHRLDGAILQRRVSDLIEQLALNSIADRRAARLSQGERMKTALGRALVHDPSHLLLDEPTNGLDVPSVHGLRDVLRRMRDRGTCIVFSSHVLDEVRALCDKVVIMAKGRVVASGDVEGICRSARCDTLEDAFLQLTRTAGVRS